MDPFREYLLRILTTAMICSVVQIYPPKGTCAELSRLICGIALSVTVIGPLCRLDLSRQIEPLLSFSVEAEDIVADGEAMAQSALSERIRTETEAYIQNKAGQLGARILAEVTVSQDPLPVPVAAAVSGACTSHEQDRIREIISSDLGIPKENITWIG